MSDSTSNTNGSPTQPAMTSGHSGGGGGGGIDDGVFTPGAFVREFQKQREEMKFLAKAFFAMLNDLAYFMSYPALILFRRRLGERMLSKAALITTWLVAAFVATTSSINVAYLITLAMPILYAVHVFQIRRRNKRGERHYSYCRGSSWLDKLLPSRPEFTAGILEPLILIAAAVVVFVYGDLMVVTHDAEMMNAQPASPKIFSIYLAAMGLGLNFVESRLRKQDRDMLLTQIDQQIISKYLASALNETQEIEDEGFAVAELANWSPEQLRMLEASDVPVFSAGNGQDGSRFDPAWDNLLDPTPPEVPPEMLPQRDAAIV